MRFRDQSLLLPGRGMEDIFQNTKYPLPTLISYLTFTNISYFIDFLVPKHLSAPPPFNFQKFVVPLRFSGHLPSINNDWSLISQFLSYIVCHAHRSSVFRSSGCEAFLTSVVTPMAAIRCCYTKKTLFSAVAILS